MFICVALSHPAAALVPVDLPRHPAISPDGTRISFSWQGDLWVAPAEGGLANRLTIEPGFELASRWTPDGSGIVFESNRTGYQNLYLLPLDGGPLRCLLEIDRSCALADVSQSADGRLRIWFHGFHEADMYTNPRPYTIEDGQPEATRVHDAFGSSPTLSPNGRWVAFERGRAAWQRRHYRGSDNRDIWLFDRENRSFHRLTHWPGNDGLPKWLNDETLLFLSDREDNCVNLYAMDLSAGLEQPPVRRLTQERQHDVQSFDVARNTGRVVLHVWDRLLLLEPAGRDAVPVQLTAPDSLLPRTTWRDVSRQVTEAALHPSGEVIAVVAYGDIFIRSTKPRSPTIRVTDGPARRQHVAWSADGTKLYFTSNENGIEQIWQAQVNLTRTEADRQTRTALRALEPPPQRSPGRPLRTQPASAPASDATASTSSAATTQTQPDTQPAASQPAASQPSRATLSPVTTTPATQPARRAASRPTSQPADPRLDPSRWQDAMRFDLRVLIAETAPSGMPSESPDGRYLAYRRGLGDLIVLEHATGRRRVLLQNWSRSLDWRWSPDSTHLAYQTEDANHNRDIWIIPADGSRPPVNISRHPRNDYAPRFSADGRILIFLSERRGGEYDVWMVYLDPALENYSPRELADYFDAAAKRARAAKPPAPATQPAATTRPSVESLTRGVRNLLTDVQRGLAGQNRQGIAEKWSLDDAYLRLRRVTTMSGNEADLEISPAGDTVYFNGQWQDRRSLLQASIEGGSVKLLGEPASVQHRSLTGDRLVTVRGGSAVIIRLPAATADTLDIAARSRIDPAIAMRQRFMEAAALVGQVFYDPTMKGLDWPALTARYADLAARARTSEEFDDIAERLLGELNASHLGIRSPSDAPSAAAASGRIGARLQREPGGLRVLSVVPGGPAARATQQILPGDLILAVDFTPLAPTDALEQRLLGMAGQPVSLRVRREAGSRRAEFDTIVVPISYAALVELRYDQWQRENQRLVHEWSDGKLGYLHIRRMDNASLEEFERDLYAAGEGRLGLIIDVRNNGGGSTADLLLASIMNQPHARTVPRGMTAHEPFAYPQDRLFIPRYVHRINMLCNERSFSNAEIIAHAFRTLKRGTLVGQQTFGGVISTGSAALLDGTSIRTPFRGWYLPDGRDMENNGAMPDLLVPSTPEDEAAEFDRQLRAAVDDLLARIAPRPAPDSPAASPHKPPSDRPTTTAPASMPNPQPATAPAVDLPAASTRPHER